MGPLRAPEDILRMALHSDLAEFGSECSFRSGIGSIGRREQVFEVAPSAQGFSTGLGDSS
jgi:hypothetical protein